jgi:hypothetical protein
VKLNQELKNKKINKNSSNMFNASCSPEKRVTSPYKKNKKLDLDDPQWGPKVVWMKMDFIWNNETYNVYMTHGLPLLACAKYQDHIVVVKQGDHANYDYICLTACRMRGTAL